jgi:hypothetical protein
MSGLQGRSGPELSEGARPALCARAALRYRPAERASRRGTGPIELVINCRPSGRSGSNVPLATAPACGRGDRVRMQIAGVPSVGVAL